MEKQITDEELDLALARVLLFGVKVAVVLVVLGAVLLLSRHGLETASYHLFVGEPQSLTSLPAIFQGLWQGHGRSLIQLGLICLVLTPVLRVALACLIFVREKDYVYVGISLFVLAILLYALISER